MLLFWKKLKITSMLLQVYTLIFYFLFLSIFFKLYYHFFSLRNHWHLNECDAQTNTNGNSRAKNAHKWYSWLFYFMECTNVNKYIHLINKLFFYYFWMTLLKNICWLFSKNLLNLPRKFKYCAFESSPIRSSRIIDFFVFQLAGRTQGHRLRWIK